MTNDAFITVVHSRRSQSTKNRHTCRHKSNLSIRSAKKNTSHKHARMESKLVTQTPTQPTGQNRHKDAFITFVTQTCHTDSSRHVTCHVNQILRESTDHKTRENEKKIGHTDPDRTSAHSRKHNICHTDEKTKFVTQTRKLNLTHRREN